MVKVTELHGAVKRGDTTMIKALLEEDRRLANAVSDTDPRRTYPLHIAAEFNQVDAARVLVAYGADVGLLDAETTPSRSAGPRSTAVREWSRSSSKPDRTPTSATSTASRRSAAR